MASCSILFLELILRMLGFFETISEKRASGYASEFNKQHDTWLHVYPPNTSFVYSTSEFKHIVNTNNEGVRDIEHSIDKDSGEYRILALGDSYTEGVGASFDSSWVRLLQNRLINGGKKKFEIINCGVAGSDPFYSIKLYSERFAKYTPDLILLVINTSDVDDMIFRGGMERFLPNGNTRYKKGPWFEPMYAKSYFIRFVAHFLLGYNGRLIKRNKMGEEERKSKENLIQAIEYLRDAAENNQSKFLLIVHPTADECAANVYRFDEEFFLQLNKKNIDYADIYNSIHETIDASNYLYYSWEKDMHYNGRGYELMANKIYLEIVDRRIDEK